MKKKQRSRSDRDKWLDECDKEFSRKIRLRDSDEYGIGYCCTCQKRLYWKEAQCGHYVSRRHHATRYDEQNCHLQCVSCNYFKDGLKYEHAKHIDELYGKGAHDKLQIKKHNVCKLTVPILMIMTKEFKDQADKLYKQKGGQK